MTQDRDDPHDDLVNSIQTHAFEVGTTTPGTDTDAFPDLYPVLDDIDIIGMGEATHRTREFAQFKHRFFRYLVRTHGLRLLGLEAQFSESLALHDYVVHGISDVTSALDELTLTIHSTEEMASFLRWMRKFNEDRPLSDRISVYGFDIQSPSGAAAALREYFDAHDSELTPAENVQESLTELTDGIIDGYDVDRDRLQTAERIIVELEDYFEPAYEGQPRSSGTDRALANQHFRTLQRGCEFARIGMEADRNTQHGLRDRYMAKTVEWILRYESVDTIALWAHNNHIKNGELHGTEGSAETMGSHLAQRYKSRYYALGFQFGGGSVCAHTLVTGEGDIEIDGKQLSRKEISVPELPAESVPRLFTRTDGSVLFLDHRSLADESCLHKWLDKVRPHYYVAGVVNPDDETTAYQNHNSVEEFDGIVFVCDVSPTTPL